MKIHSDNSCKKLLLTCCSQFITLFCFCSLVPCNTVFGSTHTMVSWQHVQVTKKYIVWTVHFSSSFEISIDRTLLHLRDFSMTMYHAARHRSFSLHMLVCLFLYPWPLFQYPLELLNAMASEWIRNRFKTDALNG